MVLGTQKEGVGALILWMRVPYQGPVEGLLRRLIGCLTLLKSVRPFGCLNDSEIFLVKLPNTTASCAATRRFPALRNILGRGQSPRAPP